MKILTFSTLFPNEIFKRHGVFVENRLNRLVLHESVSATVIAPVPWFPFKHSFFGVYAKYARVPLFETRNGIDVYHPRYLNIPKIGMSIAPFFMKLAVTKLIKFLIKDGLDFDLIDAHYFYPDGVAACGLGKIFGKPVVITARGTDLSLIPEYYLPGRMIKNAAVQAAALITVCDALKQVLLKMKIPNEKITVLRNGVDLIQFHQPKDREKLRDELGIRGFTLLSVGHLIERKGHHLVIEALLHLPDVMLLIAGDGENEKTLKKCVMELNLETRVKFLGNVPHNQLYKYYGGADSLVLASSREGWANVLLESMACGTPVVATNLWGTPEVVQTADAGILMEERSSKGIANAVLSIMKRHPDRNKTRLYAEQFDWEAVSRGQMEIFEKIIEGHNK